MAPNRYQSSHRFLVAVLLSLATLATIAGLGARWLDDQVLSTSGWTHLSGSLLDNKAVRTAVANYAVQEAFTRGGIDSALDRSLGPTAGKAAALPLRAAAPAVAGQVLRSRAARRAWRRANRSAQSELLRALDGPRPRPVVLDLRPIVTDVLHGMAATSAARSIPGAVGVLTAPGDRGGRLTILSAHQAKPLRSFVSVVRTLAWALWAVAAAMFALSLLLASGRRTRTLSRIAYRLIFAGVLVLVVRWVLQYVFADSVGTLASDRAGFRAGWLTATADLRTLAIDVAAAGVVVLLVSIAARLAARVQ